MKATGDDDSETGMNVGHEGSAGTTKRSSRSLLATGTGRTLLALVVPFVGLLGAVLYTGGSWAMDEPVFDFVDGLRGPDLSQIALKVTHLGGASFMILASLVCVVVAWRRRRRTAAFFAVALGGSAIVNVVLKALILRDRPSLIESLVIDPGGSSFPSGHSQSTMTIALALILVLQGRSRLWRLLFLLPATVGLSRIYLGVHFPTDVVGGWLLGAIVVLLTRDAFERLFPQRAKSDNEAPSDAH